MGSGKMQGVEGAMLGQCNNPLVTLFVVALSLELWTLCFSETWVF